MSSYYCLSFTFIFCVPLPQCKCRSLDSQLSGLVVCLGQSYGRCFSQRKKSLYCYSCPGNFSIIAHQEALDTSPYRGAPHWWQEPTRKMNKHLVYFLGRETIQGWGYSWLAATLLPLKRRVHSAHSVTGRSNSVHPPGIPAPCLTWNSRSCISKSKLSLCISSNHESHCDGQQLCSLQGWSFVLWLPVHEEQLPKSLKVATVLSFHQ